MKAYEFTNEAVDVATTLPSEPGTEPIKPGYVRLYHQTTEDNLKSIMRNGITIAHAQGIEGPRAIYASETGFYGAPGTRPTVEFQIPKNMWDSPFVLTDVSPDMIIAGHLPWHRRAQYILDHPNTMREVLAGQHDDLTGDYAPAVAFIKRNYSHG